jgi:hypothetical protein
MSISFIILKKYGKFVRREDKRRNARKTEMNGQMRGIECKV